jgi:uncharacterized protein (TIGR03437 family)
MNKRVFTRLLIGLSLALATMTPALAQPSVAIVNGASFKASFPVSPGSWASAFGNFASVGITTETQNGVLPVPTTLGGVQVLVNNVAAPLNYVGPSQINFVVPAGTAEGKHPLKITVSNLTTFDGFINVWPVSPGIFIKNPADVLQPGAVLNQISPPTVRTTPLNAKLFRSTERAGTSPTFLIRAEPPPQAPQT